MSFTQSDHQFMQRALELARLGEFSTDPNPRVGCVFVKDGRVISEGWTQPAGDLHAEAIAIRNANESLAGTDCYVTLEPCSHFGKTPPCADALIQSGVARVVIAIGDPNPAVAGKGIAALRDSGISVETGLCAEEAYQINRGFLKRISTGLPFVTMKMGMSMDAKTAMASGESQWITSPESRKMVQHLRARSAAVITGRQTVVSDNPSMNVRPDELPDADKHKVLHQPVRVILDSKRSLSGDERIFTLDKNYLWVSSVNKDKTTEQCLHAPTQANGKIELTPVLKHLAELGCNEVLIEAGAELSGAFVDADLVDEIQLFMAPVMLGHDARDLIRLPGMQQLSDKKQFEFTSARQIGADVQLVFQRGD